VQWRTFFRVILFIQKANWNVRAHPRHQSLVVTTYNVRPKNWISTGHVPLTIIFHSPIPTPNEFQTMCEAQKLQQNYTERQSEIKNGEKCHSSSEFNRSNSQMLQVWRKSHHRPKIINPKNHQQCDKCHTSVTPQWRKGPNGPASLCNACGLRYASRCKKEQDIRIRTSISLLVNPK